MRRILVDNARRKQRDKRGGDRQRVDLQEHDVPVAAPADQLVAFEEDVVALDQAPARLTKEDPAAARVVQLHFFAGLPIEQVADTLGVSRATAYRQWAYARAWLRWAMGQGEAPA